MDSADVEVLRAAIEWRAHGRGVWLITIARTWGSSPRPAGSLAAVRDDGTVVGSVSSGCVEDDLAGRLASGVLPVTAPRVETYGVTRDQIHRIGLPCGGRLDLVIEKIADVAWLHTVVEQMEARTVVARRVNLTTGVTDIYPATANQAFEFDGVWLTKIFGPSWSMLLVGAGQLSRFVAQMAVALDYRVIVCDPRDEYAANWRVAGTEIDARMPDEAVQSRADARTAVIALTHDAALDDPALEAALVSRAFYVGAIGSRINAAKRRARLATLGVPPAALARLRGPVGLPLGGRTPAEIAVAILAELTAVRHGVQLRAVDDTLLKSAGLSEPCPALQESC